MERYYEWVKLANLHVTPDVVFFLVLALVAVLLLWPKRGSKMKQERRTYVEVLAVDGIVSHVEDMVANETITREEAVEIYLKLKKTFPIRDLFPAVETLKANILSRLSRHDNDPVTLPPIQKEKPRHAFDRG